MPDAPHEPKVFTFLFCQEVVEERHGTLSLFRLVEVVAIKVDPEAIWPSIKVHVFLGISCEVEGRHSHDVALHVTDPNGKSLGNGEVVANFSGGDSTVAYRDIATPIPSRNSGRYRFDISVDGLSVATRYFTIRHTGLEVPGDESLAQ